jgi:hypothetical protein
VHRNLHDRSQNRLFFLLRPYAPRVRALARIDSAERRAAMAELPQRMADGGLPTMATDPERE